MTEILILDYERPNELRALVDSLNSNCFFEKKIVVLNNGGERYADELLKEGRVHKVINNSVNIGCGAGTVQLFSQCESEYAFYVQVDHLLAGPISEEDVLYFQSMIAGSTLYVDLAGNQGHGKYSERAQFIRRDDYLRIPKSFGGPGPLEDLMWTEESVQIYMRERKLGFVSFFLSEKIPYFIDCGWSSIRSNPDGSKWIHAPDNKNLICLIKPTRKFTFPPLNDKEWHVAIAGEWPVEGAIPEVWKNSSFNVWNKKLI